MNGVLSKLRGTLWWLLPLAALVALIAMETDFGRAVHLPVQTAERVPAKPVNVSLMPEYTIEGGIAKHTETVARPLFVPTRRPAPVAVVEVAKPKMPRGQFALTGTTVAGERSLAFLKETQGGKSRTVKQGDSINGLLVAEVKPDRVKLTFGDEAEELVLKVQANPKSTPQPHVAGAPGTPQIPGQPGVPVQALQQQIQQQAQAANTPAEAPEHSQTLAERRRAARAAQAAAAAAHEAQQGQAAPQAQAAPGTTAQPETGWAAIYQRYQQRHN